ncbi:MAG: hypothetical protein E6Q33_03190 [Neisseriales bacterium]|nr:MAG: hypothetical protein E6Q33_03190 [Neisseriales bacterium]
MPYFDSKTIFTDQINESTTILSSAFKSWLKSISDILNKKLVSVLHDKFLLRKHLNSIKMFYLIGQGDFIQKLMDSLHNMLMKPKHMIN